MRFSLQEMHPWPLYQPARWGPRVMSALVDLSMLAGLWVLCGIGICVWIGMLNETTNLVGLFLGNPGMAAGAVLIWTVITGVAAWGYFPLMRSACGRTVGEALWGLRVVREDGGSLKAGDALKRGLGGVLSLIPLGVGYWCVWLNRQGRTWHGILSRTRVVETLPRFCS